MLHVCDSGCEVEIGMSEATKLHRCEAHGQVLRYAKALKRERPNESFSKKRKPMKRGRGFAASPAQQRKVKNLPCIVTGRDRHDEETITAAHLWDRSQGGCDNPLCVVPLTVAPHTLYDEHKLDLLPYLINRGCFAEMAHVIEAHHVSPTQLLERLTGEKWAPLESPPLSPKKEGERV